MAHVVFVESNPAGLEAFAAAKAAGHYVTFVYAPGNAHLYGADVANRAFANVDRFVPVVDTMSAGPLERALESIRSERPIDAVITVLEYCVLPLAEAASRLGLPYTSLDAIRIARDKKKLRDALEKAGVERVHSRYLASRDDCDEWSSFPAIVKPAAGAASFYASVVRDADELGAEFDRLSAALGERKDNIGSVVRSAGLIVEEYLEGEMLSVEVAVGRSETQVLTIGSRKRRKDNEVIELGTLMPAALAEATREQVENHAQKVVQALGFDKGIVHVEMILTRDGPRVIEVNPRLMGGTLPLLYRKVHDTEVFSILIDLHLGHALPPATPRSRRYGVSRVFGAVSEARVSPRFDLDWLNQFEEFAVDLKLSVAPGQSVAALASNHDYLGRFMLTAPSADAANTAADHIIDRLSQTLGVELAV